MKTKCQWCDRSVISNDPITKIEEREFSRVIIHSKDHLENCLAPFWQHRVNYKSGQVRSKACLLQ